jgi:hypothetical protein
MYYKDYAEGSIIMKQIPTQINALYETQLNQKAIPKKICPYYKKWLRYYLDFCHKYNHESSVKKSFAHYISLYIVHYPFNIMR